MTENPGSGSRADGAARVVAVLGGLVAIGISIVVLANPLVSVDTLIVLLAAALASDSLQLVVSAGARVAWWHRVRDEFRSGLGRVRRFGRIGLGLLALGIVAAILLRPSLGPLPLLYLLASGVVVLSIERLLQVVGRGVPTWFRGLSAGTATLAVLLIVLAVTVPSVGLATFAVLIAVAMLLGGIQSVVAGFRPTDPRQIVLLEVVLFSLLYGLVLINWIDLPSNKGVPAYSVWLVLTYFAPFWMVLIYEGFSEWPLFVTLGLLVSLANDVGYFFVGNLFFGFHVNLPHWLAGQLGLFGSQAVTTFEAGFVAFNVPSWLMGLTIYLRAALVVAGLYYWWEHPGRIVARLPAADADPA